MEGKSWDTGIAPSSISYFCILNQSEGCQSSSRELHLMIKERSDEVISVGSKQSTVGQVSVHDVSDGEDICHDKEALGSHLGLSLYFCILRANHKMLIENLLLFWEESKWRVWSMELKSLWTKAKHFKEMRGEEKWIQSSSLTVPSQADN